jgi:putative IMPACT (imprinted ancient) family translation regulator
MYRYSSPIVNSPPFTDRRSTFVAHAAPVTNQAGAVQFQNYVRQLRSKDHPREADHEMLGWRSMSLKVGKDGLGGEDDWTTKTGGDDDGEKGGGAQVRKSVEEAGGVDVAVVVSRWYGGE